MVDDFFVSDMDGQRIRWAMYINSCTTGPPSRQLSTAGGQVIHFLMLREVVARLKVAKGADVYITSAELFKATRSAMTQGIHMILTVV